jgi:hypothetical protein
MQDDMTTGTIDFATTSDHESTSHNAGAKYNTVLADCNNTSWSDLELEARLLCES